MAKYRKRQWLVEHPFGTVKRQFGAYYLLTKGIDSVSAEMGLTFCAKAFREKIKSLQLHRKTGCKIDMIAEVINPIIRGWINYFVKYNSQAIKYSLDCVDRRLVKWALCKFKRFRGHRKRAERWLSEVQKRDPKLFAHWQYRNKNIIIG